MKHLEAAHQQQVIEWSLLMQELGIFGHKKELNYFN